MSLNTSLELCLRARHIRLVDRRPDDVASRRLIGATLTNFFLKNAISTARRRGLARPRT
jgi:hypothetical protein